MTRNIESRVVSEAWVAACDVSRRWTAISGGGQWQAAVHNGRLSLRCSAHGLPRIAARIRIDGTARTAAASYYSLQTRWFGRHAVPGRVGGRTLSLRPGGRTLSLRAGESLDVGAISIGQRISRGELDGLLWDYSGSLHYGRVSDVRPEALPLDIAAYFRPGGMLAAAVSAGGFVRGRAYIGEELTVWDWGLS